MKMVRNLEVAKEKLMETLPVYASICGDEMAPRKAIQYTGFNIDDIVAFVGPALSGDKGDLYESEYYQVEVDQCRLECLNIGDWVIQRHQHDLYFSCYVVNGYQFRKNFKEVK